MQLNKFTKTVLALVVMLNVKGLNPTMQNYVDQQLMATALFDFATIIALDGTVQGTSDSAITVDQTNFNKLLDFFSTQNPDILTAAPGFKLQMYYIYFSGTDTVARFKKLKYGLHVFKTLLTVIIARYVDPVQPQQASNAVEKLGEYMISTGY